MLEDPSGSFVVLDHEPVVLMLELVVFALKFVQPPESRPKDRGKDDHADERDEKEMGSDLGHEDDLQRPQPVREQGRSRYGWAGPVRLATSEISQRCSRSFRRRT